MALSEYNYNIITKGRRELQTFVINNSIVKQAQFVLKNELDNASIEQLKDLIRRMYLSNLKTWAMNGNQLTNASNVVVSWNNVISKIQYAGLRSIALMKTIEAQDENINSMPDIIKELLTKLLEKSETLSIHIFKKYDLYNFWVIADDPSTNIVSQYFDIYIKYIEKSIDKNYDLLVFGKNEINNNELPNDCISLNRSGAIYAV